MKAQYVALIGGALCLLLAACSAGGAIPAASPQTSLQSHAAGNGHRRHHATQRVRDADCPLDTGGVNPGNQTC